MAVQPIDMQTVLVRLSQIGKEQAAQQNAATHGQAIMGDEIARTSEERARMVRQTNELEEGPESVHDEEGSQSRRESQERKEREEEKDNVWRDPDLGQNVDITG